MTYIQETKTLRFYAHLIPNSDLDNVESFEKSIAQTLAVTLSV